MTDSPHAELLDLFEALETELEVQEYAWSLAHDSCVIEIIYQILNVNHLIQIPDSHLRLVHSEIDRYRLRCPCSTDF